MSGADAKKLVGRFFSLKKQYTGGLPKVSSATWAREVSVAKKLLTAPDQDYIEGIEAYTADEIAGCLESMFIQGANVWSLSIFIKNYYLIDDWLRDGDSFTAPDWVLGDTHGNDSWISNF